jgi:hypothetical protein
LRRDIVIPTPTLCNKPKALGLQSPDATKADKGIKKAPPTKAGQSAERQSEGATNVFIIQKSCQKEVV